MKTVRLLLIAIGIGALVWANASAGGRQEATERGRVPDEGREQSQSEDTAQRQTVQQPQELMRRVSAVGARFGAQGGTWTEVELPEEYQGQPAPAGTGRDFRTDFSRAAISYEDIVAGGPPKDGIPSIDEPLFVDVESANAWLEENEPVILYRAGGQARVYPLQILTWHEIVNDTAGDKPIAVTYCPLCNTGMVFDRRFDDTVFEFGVSGRLIYSNMIMYDRTSESWWIQASGQAIAGEFAGQRLRLLPSSMLSWRDVRRSYPEAEVLSRDTGYRRNYGRNPYLRYDSAERPFLYRGPEVVPEDQNPMERVLTVYHGDAVAAVPYSLLHEEGIVELELDGEAIVVFGQPGTASALDAQRISDGKDVGSAAAFYAEAEGRRLSFDREDGVFRDRETGTTWSITGRGISGRYSGVQLEQALAVEHFLFSYRAFHQASE